MFNPKPLAGRIALITGASRGLGKAMALALSGAGAAIALTARDKAALDSVAHEIRQAGGRAEVFTADVTGEDAVQLLEVEVKGRLGAVDILINNAGINIRKPAIEFTLAEWRQVMDTNLTSAFLMCRAFVPHMRGRGYGRVVNLTSMMSHISLPGRSAYSASKAGLIGFTKSLALELAPDHITVNGISPGPCATEINKPILENPVLSQQFISKIPVGRWGKVEEVAALALHLCRDESAFITGTDILIDGGWTAQ